MLEKTAKLVKTVQETITGGKDLVVPENLPDIPDGEELKSFPVEVGPFLNLVSFSDRNRHLSLVGDVIGLEIPNTPKSYAAKWGDPEPEKLWRAMTDALLTMLKDGEPAIIEGRPRSHVTGGIYCIAFFPKGSVRFWETEAGFNYEFRVDAMRYFKNSIKIDKNSMQQFESEYDSLVNLLEKTAITGIPTDPQRPHPRGRERLAIIDVLE